MSWYKLRPTNAVTICLALSVFLSTAFSVYLLNKPLFFTLQLWQLITVALGVAVPLLILNFSMYGLMDTSSKVADNEASNQDLSVRRWGVASLFAATSINLGLFIAVRYNAIGLKSFYMKLFSFELVLAITLFVIKVIEESIKSRERRKNPTVVFNVESKPAADANEQTNPDINYNVNPSPKG